MALNNSSARFISDGLLFGIEVEKVQEVIRHQTMTRVPLAPKLIGGLDQPAGTNRDRHRFAIAARACRSASADELPMNVVARTEAAR